MNHTVFFPSPPEAGALRAKGHDRGVRIGSLWTKNAWPSLGLPWENFLYGRASVSSSVKWEWSKVYGVNEGCIQMCFNIAPAARMAK